jgi:hypothetical protein
MPHARWFVNLETMTRSQQATGLVEIENMLATTAATLHVSAGTNGAKLEDLATNTSRDLRELICMNSLQNHQVDKIGNETSETLRLLRDKTTRMVAIDAVGVENDAKLQDLVNGKTESLQLLEQIHEYVSEPWNSTGPRLPTVCSPALSPFANHVSAT